MPKAVRCHAQLERKKVPPKVGDQAKTDLPHWTLNGDFIHRQNWAHQGVSIRASNLYKIWPFLSSSLLCKYCEASRRAGRRLHVSHSAKPKGLCFCCWELACDASRISLLPNLATHMCHAISNTNEFSGKSEWRSVWQGRGKCGSNGEGVKNWTTPALKSRSEVSHFLERDLTVC